MVALNTALCAHNVLAKVNASLLTVCASITVKSQVNRKNSDLKC
jgi:hypothetical protein